MALCPLRLAFIQISSNPIIARIIPKKVVLSITLIRHSFKSIENEIMLKITGEGQTFNVTSCYKNYLDTKLWGLNAINGRDKECPSEWMCSKCYTIYYLL